MDNILYFVVILTLETKLIAILTLVEDYKNIIKNF